MSRNVLTHKKHIQTMRAVTTDALIVRRVLSKVSVPSTSAHKSSSLATTFCRAAHRASSSTSTSTNYEVDSVLELNCHSIASDGSGVCRLPDDRICLVTGATPDEHAKILVKITQVKKQVAFGVKVSRQNDERLTNYQQPFCAHFATCGGCSWQDVKYDRQLDLKRTMVVESFAKNGKLGMDAANALVEKTVGLKTNLPTKRPSTAESTPQKWKAH